MINTEKHGRMGVAAMLLLLRRPLSDAVLSAHSRK